MNHEPKSDDPSSEASRPLPAGLFSMSGQPLLEDYSLWLIPSGAEYETLTQTIKDLSQLETDSPPFIPHITLFYPVPRSTKLETITVAIRDIISNVSQSHDLSGLKLELRPAQSGTLYYQSVLAPVNSQSDSPLLALRAACKQQWGKKGSEKEMEKPYFPHLSLLYGDLTQERRDEIAGLVNGKGSLPSEVKAEEIVVVDCRSTPDRWEIVARVSVSAP